MDYIKEAFQKVRQDVDLLKKEFDVLRESMVEICEIIQKLEQNNSLDRQTDTSTDKHKKATDSTYLSTDDASFKPLNDQYLGISTGNVGVPTDKQTDTSTDRQTEKLLQNKENSIDNAVEILDSLDNIKKEIRLKFKRLTEQELLVFSTLYQLDRENGFSDYKFLAKKLNLSESSIRDYIGRLIKKGIPVEKKKINNKNIQLSIPSNLKKIASLPTILQLRDL